MARYTYTVTINGVGYSNIQSIQMTSGRASVQDPFKTATAVISGRSLVGFTKPTIGYRVLIYASGNLCYDGTVADVTIRYGIVAAEDTWEIRCEDALAQAGRTVVSGSWGATNSCYTDAVYIANVQSISMISTGPSPSSSIASMQAIDNANLLTVLQTLVQTEQGRIQGFGPSSLAWTGRKDMARLTVLASFTDGTLGAGYTTAKYDAVTFASMADNYATTVVVNPVGLAPQSSGSGYRTFSMDSYDVSTTQAANLAGYVKNTLAVATDVPSSLSCLAEEQSNDAALSLAQYGATGYQMEIILRGVSYRCVVEGVTITATPESSRFTYYLSSSQAYQFLILNDAVYGKLGTGKLGF